MMTFGDKQRYSSKNDNKSTMIAAVAQICIVYIITSSNSIV